MVAIIEPISAFYTKIGRYPGNNKQWWVARVEQDNPDAEGGAVKAGDFSPVILDKLFSGNNRAPRGHFILNAFNKNRSSVSGVADIPVETTDERPTTVAFFSGRVWYGCNSSVYYSQHLTERYKAGMCYQEADPTSEEISDLIATDGGVIQIPEASKIIRLVPSAGGIIVFATNGVWNITGGNGGFTALDISINKISPVGCRSPMSVVETDSGIFWWSEIGILGMTQKSGMYGPIEGAFDRTNISESTIQSFYNDISEEAKTEVKGVLDSKANRIMWLYRDDDVGPHQYNRVLNFDLALGAFYPWKFSTKDDVDPDHVKGVYISPRLNTFMALEPDSINDYTDDLIPSSVEYFSMKANEGRVCQLSNRTFVDWGSEPYNSYVESGYELFNDAMRKKAITYIFTYLRRTEKSWTLVDGEPKPDNPSSCYMRIKFDWSSSEASNKWTTPVQVYRPTRLLFGDDSGVIDDGHAMVTSKNKVRGSGKAIQFRFGTDEPGRNFDLFGWSIAATGNTIP